MAPSEYYDDSCLSDYSRQGGASTTLAHSPAFSSYGTNEAIHHHHNNHHNHHSIHTGTTEAGIAASFHPITLAHDSMPMAGSNAVAPELWT